MMVVVALGLALLGSGYIAEGGEKEHDSMKIETVQAGADPSTQPMETSASGSTQSATFALG